MMRVQNGWGLAVVLLMAGTLLVPVSAMAQEDADEGDGAVDEIEEALGEEIAETEAALNAEKDAEEEPEQSDEILPEIGEEDRLAEFTLERGLYAAASLGAFESLGGTQNLGNVQPFMVVRLGYDINDFLSVFTFVSQAYNSGNPWTEADGLGAGGAEVANFGMLSVGGAVVGSLRATERFAVEPHVGAGYTSITPSLTDSDLWATGDGSGRVSGGILVAGGVDLTYLTLLTDFSAGISLNFHYVMASGTDPIMGFGQAFNVRYTF